MPVDLSLMADGTKGEFFDKLSVPSMTIDDLDLDALSKMLGKPVDENTLRRLHLARPDQGELVPTNGGVLLAGKYREEAFPFAWVQCGRFRGEDRVDIFDQIEVHTHLPWMVDGVMGFLTKHAFRAAEFGEIRRRDVWSIPVVPLREIVINAVVHTAYGGAHSPIRVAFMDDRIEVDSPGGLMPGLTVDDMLAGVSKIRNPVLAGVFQEMELVEQWGSGIPRVVKALAAEGLPAPEFVELPGRLRVVVRVRNHRPSIAPTPGTTRGAHYESEHEGERGGPESEHDSEHDGRESEHDGEQAEGGSEQDALLRSRHALAVLIAAQASPLRRDELLGRVGISNAYGNYRRNIVPLVDAGLLAMTEPAQSKNQRYRLTNAGREYIAGRKAQ
jgi:hypothetical protein